VIFSLQALQPKLCAHLLYPPVCYMPCPSHLFWFDHPNNI
jgi:hypothetical protein